MLFIDSFFSQTFLGIRTLFQKNVVHMFHMRTPDSIAPNVGYLEYIA